MPLLSEAEILNAFEDMQAAQRVEMAARFKWTEEPNSHVLAREATIAAEATNALSQRFNNLFAEYRRQHG
jgi:hypothetical protein